MNPEIRDQWIAALESGEFLQGEGCLTQITADGTEKNCCLGVLTELAVKAGAISRVGVYQELNRARIGYGAHDEKSTLPCEVRLWAGLSDSNPAVEYVCESDPEQNGIYSLAELNDGSRTDEALEFTEIAKLIREQL